MGLLKDVQNTTDETTQIIPLYRENATFSSTELCEKGSSFILIPLGVLLGIIILALLVYRMASNKNRYVRSYCKKRSGHRRFLYEDTEYDSPLEQDTDVMLEEEEDEVDNDIDNPTKSLLRGKLQINNRYENYLSTSHLNRSSDLFT